MSYDRSTEFRWFNERGTEITLQVDFECSYDSASDELKLDAIHSIRFDDPFGNELEWSNVLATFRPTLIKAIKGHVALECLSLTNNIDFIVTARDDYQSSTEEHRYETSRDEL